MVKLVVAIVTHTDIDGVGAAGLYVYLTGASEYRLFFTEPFLLDRELRKVLSAYYEKVVIADLGVNPPIFSQVLEYLKVLRENGIPVVWYDHHVWDEEWVQRVKDVGVELIIDRSTCATGVVAKYTKPARNNVDWAFVNTLVEGICAGDLWRFDHWLGGFYIRLVRRRDTDSWRKSVVKAFASGKLFSEEFYEKIVEHVDRELRVLSGNLEVVVKNLNGINLAVAMNNEDIENSFLASHIIGRFDADVVVLVSIDGKLSFRSRHINVRELAVKLGGGGHPYAAGAKIEIPLLVRILSRFSRKVLLYYVSQRVSRELESMLVSHGGH
jgi:oligoribonuclease NrnB/cAMP/cGMP phosphodiesterase (DHH superfamily)